MRPMKNKIIILFVIILVIGLSFWGYKFWSERKVGGAGDGEQVFCTMEALLCPDGSYVGRSGPKCEFSKCPNPNQGFLTGILRQDSNGFNLLMASPEEGMDVAYVMPIEIKVSNVLGQIVGKKVSVFGYFTSGNSFYVERLEELKDSDPTLGDVRVGQMVFINGVKITLNKVVQDSRCPADVQCIEAGAINTNVTLQSSTDKETRNMPSDEVPISFDSYKISIEKINPPRMSGSEVNQKDYIITFRVRSN